MVDSKRADEARQLALRAGLALQILELVGCISPLFCLG